jgi:hypothetical protein
MSQLQELLALLEDQWRRHDLPIAARLRPGLSEDEVRTRLATVDVTPSREYVEWFGWHDGASTESRMTPVHRIETLTRCIKQYTTHVNPVVLEEDTNAGWFPVATTIGGAVVVTDCTGSSPDLAITTVVSREGERYGPDYHLPSLVVPVRWWVDRFTTGTWAHEERFPEAVQNLLDDLDEEALEEALSAFPRTARHLGFIC